MNYLTPCCLSLSLLLVACAKEDTSETVVVKKPVTTEPVTGEDVKQKMGEAMETTKEFTKQKRDEYAAKLQEKLDEMNAEIAKLKDKGADLKDDAKVKWNEQLDELKKRRDHVSVKLKEFNESSAEAWAGLKKDLDIAWKNLKQAYDKTKEEVKE
ncbi:hypothetical protein Pan153_30470 [Gimesia panareensis]|uniref:Apolipoprotein A1/A4/E domain protein n=1 Tax=Gimesia panareensis TaxID=2527978 RepID=A0A518FPW3_9PLAN|nr:aminoacyltransferase [Gimesia panareensis]QDV18389.1 hypothetical protein Pan153_30470 [Gimesia panareensis]